MRSTSIHFKQNAIAALRDSSLQQALAKARGGFIDKRRHALEALPEFEQLRETARELKELTLANMRYYLEQFELRAAANGTHVHWVRDAGEACRCVTSICRDADARLVTKGKSMVAEEIGLNEALEAAGLEVVETDLGEYIIQLANEPPSHIIAPAVHKTRQQIAGLFREHHAHQRPLESVKSIVDEARDVLRDKFVRADVGITGANFLIAETGMAVIVTNEGNGDLTATLPHIHIVIASIEKIVPTLEDATVLLRLLGRSATGQELTSYTSFFGGPRGPADLDGPAQFHIVLLDNGRSDMLGNDFHDMLRCIHCGACLNHCPVYGAIGGHAYGWVYPGPMGAVLTPLLTSLQQASDLPNASTLCGRCEEVCPMSIPLPKLLRTHRNQAHQQRLVPARNRILLSMWAVLARRPRLYHRLMNIGVRLLAWLGGGKGYLRHLPFARAWTAHRVLPAPEGETFLQQWQRQQGNTCE